jgi:hypothetical protein
MEANQMNLMDEFFKTAWTVFYNFTSLVDDCVTKIIQTWIMDP